MLRVKTYVGPSQIEGLGLFAAEFIPAGTRVWDPDPGIDVEVTEEHLKTLHPVAQEQIKKYAFLDDGVWVICMDDARHMNHSDNPNTENSGEGTVASCDIQPGEELTSDYREICDYTATTGEL